MSRKFYLCDLCAKEQYLIHQREELEALKFERRLEREGESEGDREDREKRGKNLEAWLLAFVVKALVFDVFNKREVNKGNHDTGDCITLLDVYYRDVFENLRFSWIWAMLKFKAKFEKVERKDWCMSRVKKTVKEHKKLIKEETLRRVNEKIKYSTRDQKVFTDSYEQEWMKMREKEEQEKLLFEKKRANDILYENEKRGESVKEKDARIKRYELLTSLCMDIAACEIADQITFKVEENCQGCEWDKGSQRDHDCMVMRAEDRYALYIVEAFKELNHRAVWGRLKYKAANKEIDRTDWCLSEIMRTTGANEKAIKERVFAELKSEE